MLGMSHLPFLAPWKKNLTTKTCRTAIPTIMITSIKLKLKILCSVLLTVLKLRFSLVRKYFCIRLIVLNCPLTLKIESSREECCSGLEPAFWGKRADFDSCSTYWDKSVRIREAMISLQVMSYSNLKIHHLVSICRHFIAETEAVLSN